MPRRPASSRPSEAPPRARAPRRAQRVRSWTRDGDVQRERDLFPVRADHAHEECVVADSLAERVPSAEVPRARTQGGAAASVDPELDATCIADDGDDPRDDPG